MSLSRKNNFLVPEWIGGPIDIFRCGHSHRKQCIGSIHGRIHQFLWSLLCEWVLKSWSSLFSDAFLRYFFFASLLVAWCMVGGKWALRQKAYSHRPRIGIRPKLTGRIDIVYISVAIPLFQMPIRLPCEWALTWIVEAQKHRGLGLVLRDEVCCGMDALLGWCCFGSCKKQQDCNDVSRRMFWPKRKERMNALSWWRNWHQWGVTPILSIQQDCIISAETMSNWTHPHKISILGLPCNSPKCQCPSASWIEEERLLSQPGSKSLMQRSTHVPFVFT